MAKRFTDSRKWYDPWYRKLSTPHKLFWHYLIDTCDHAGFWKVDIEMAAFCIGEPLIEEEVLQAFNLLQKNRITVLRKDLWWLPTFIPFQYGKLNPNNNLHTSIIHKLKTLGAGQGLVRGRQAPMVKVKDKVKDKDKDKDKEKKKDNTDQDFIKTLQDNPSYKHINIENELGKMDAWLSTRKGRLKTRRFVVNWLNKIDKPVASTSKKRLAVTAQSLTEKYKNEQ